MLINIRSQLIRLIYGKKQEDFMFITSHMMTEWLMDSKKRMRVIQKARALHCEHYMGIPMSIIKDDFDEQQIQYLKDRFNEMFGLFYNRLKSAVESYEQRK